MTRTFKVYNKIVKEIIGHRQHNQKNAPPSKSYDCVMGLETGNPTFESVQKVPFDYLIQKGNIHTKLWDYILKKGQTALPSSQKTVQRGVQWLHPMFQQHKAKK